MFCSCAGWQQPTKLPPISFLLPVRSLLRHISVGLLPSNVCEHLLQRRRAWWLRGCEGTRSRRRCRLGSLPRFTPKDRYRSLSPSRYLTPSLPHHGADTGFDYHTGRSCIEQEQSQLLVTASPVLTHLYPSLVLFLPSLPRAGDGCRHAGNEVVELVLREF